MINFRIFGINIGISVGFAGVICLMLYIDKAGFMLPTVMAVIFHELGHLIALILLKSKPKSVELKVGAISISGNFILSRKNEVIMFLAGPFLNIFLFVVLYSCYCLFGLGILLNFSLVMLVVGIFNFLPIMGLDGGSILIAFLSVFLKEKIANAVLAAISIVTVMLIILLGTFVLADTKSNISLILMGLYLFLGILLSKKKKNDCKIH